MSKKWSLVSLAVLALALLLAGHSLAQELQPTIPTNDFTGAPAYKVIRIIDGDTVVLSMDGKETKVRLIGVDTPETAHPNKPVERYGKEASQFIKNLLRGESVYVEYESGASNLDKYGRLLAYLYRAPDGLFINLEIIRQGYGHAYTQYPFQYMELFRSYERKAAQAKKGLWAPQKSQSPRTEVPGKTQTSPEKRGITVYITRTGSKYHQAGCRYLSRSMIPISLENAKQRYGPCSVCTPPF